jgi:outer membrane protein OmpA-like peptidoglycan-associated protein
LPKYNLQYDGFTTLLQAACRVVPGEIYHIEIVIADVSDFILDSGVYLAGNSFRSTGDKIIPVENPFQPAPMPADTLAAGIPAIPEMPVNSLMPAFREARVEFLFDTFFLTDSATLVIGQLYEYIKQYPQALVEITGHTDAVGTDPYNVVLSRNRAQAVVNYLTQLGVPESQIRMSYKGEGFPMATNQTVQGRARNRRVELLLRF